MLVIITVLIFASGHMAVTSIYNDSKLFSCVFHICIFKPAWATHTLRGGEGKGVGEREREVF